MDTVPVEILVEILSHAPPPTRGSLRLTCRSFAAATKGADFTTLAAFIDPDVAVATIEAASRDLTRRPRSIWSPRCLVPDGLPVPESFKLAMYAGLAGRGWPASTPITTEAMAARLRRDDITEDNLRQALFRYVLYLSYTDQRGAAQHEWVLRTLLGR